MTDQEKKIEFEDEYGMYGKSKLAPGFTASSKGLPGAIFNPVENPNNPSNLMPGQSISDLTFISGISQRFIRISMNPVTNQTNFQVGQSAGTMIFVDASLNKNVSIGDVDDPSNPANVFIGQQRPTTRALIVTGPIQSTQGSRQTELALINDSNNPGANQPVLSVQGTSEVAGTPIVQILSAIFGGGAGPKGPPLQVEQQGLNNTYPTVLLTQESLISTKFQRYFGLEKGQNSGNFLTIYISMDGTTPNANLSGNAGDICLNGPSGQPFYCTGTTNWTGM